MKSRMHGFVSAIFLVGASSLSAQVVSPSLPITAAGTSVVPVSAAEASYHVTVQEQRLKEAIPYSAAHYPIDSINMVVTATGAHWLARLSPASIQGMQLDPASRVSVAAGQEVQARSEIAARLATPKLSFQDRAFTLLTAVQSFSTATLPERLPTAEAYLTQLDAMGDSAAVWQFRARLALINTYYQLGRSADIIRHGVYAIHRVPVMPFYDRIFMFALGGTLYNATVEALTGSAGGRGQIEALNSILRQATVPKPSDVARDSGCLGRGRYYRQAFGPLFVITEKLGTKGSPVISNYWVNQPSHDSSAVRVDDGTIRVLEGGNYECLPCLMALHALQRLHVSFPDVQTIMMTWTTGYWGNRLVSPEEGAARLENFFVNTAKVTIPIAVWKGKKVLNEDGGMTPENLGPNFEHYQFLAKPTIWVLDGQGRIRRVFLGFSRELEPQLVNTVQFLRREAASQRVSASASLSLQSQTSSR